MAWMLLVYRYIGLGCLCLACYWYIDILDLAGYALHATSIMVCWSKLAMQYAPPCLVKLWL